MTAPTLLAELQNNYSDMFKEVYGYRPRDIHADNFNSLSWLDTELKFLAQAALQNMREENAREQVAIQKFEATVTEIIEIGAGDRETALRWLFDDTDFDTDPDYHCWKLGLPFGYLTA